MAQIALQETADSGLKWLIYPRLGIKNLPDLWGAKMGLNAPNLRYDPPVVSTFLDTRLAIATAKDRPSVVALLESYHLTHLFDDRRVLDKEMGRHKSAHLERLAELERVALSEITFIDDKLNHLESVAPLGVRCALAAWGYNGEREQRAAREKGYLVCQLEDVEEQLFPTG